MTIDTIIDLCQSCPTEDLPTLRAYLDGKRDLDADSLIRVWNWLQDCWTVHLDGDRGIQDEIADISAVMMDAIEKLTGKVFPPVCELQTT